jgi:hypothetical protein
VRAAEMRHGYKDSLEVGVLDCKSRNHHPTQAGIVEPIDVALWEQPT